MTLTKADVAHLKAGDEVTARFTDSNDRVVTITGHAYESSASHYFYVGGWILRDPNGEPGRDLIEIISPKPPVPRMTEPTWPGAVVMTGNGLFAVRGYATPARRGWYGPCFGRWFAWDELSDPRPLTDAERREYGIPETVPPGHVAVRVDDIEDTVVGEATRGRSFTSDECQEFEASMALLAARAAVAIKAQREAE